MCHKENFNAVQEAIKIAAAEVNRKPREISLVAVSKTQPIDKIEKLISLGQKVFGENKVQEAKKKWGPLKSKYNRLELHLIGALQTNKVKDSLEIFDVYQTLDREKLAKEFCKFYDKILKKIFFIQINIGKEENKSGIMPEDANDFINFCYHDLKMNVKGLMCIPPINEDPVEYFKKIENIGNKHRLEYLSLGMSADYEIGIKAGATHIRVGTKIFGER